MNNNEYLQKMHEGMPGAWLYQIKCQWPPLNNRWLKQGSPCWRSDRKHRLVPIVPEGCNPPPEESYAYGPDRPGAVCIQGPVKLPEGVKDLCGWYYSGFKWTGGNKRVGILDGPYLLKLSDPNAAAILALNRPDWTLPSVGPELPEDMPPLPDEWEYVGMGDAMEYGEECLLFNTSLRRWQGPNPCGQNTYFHYARRKQPEREACDGNHGGPRCSDPECWNDDPAPALVIPADIAWDLNRPGELIAQLRGKGYKFRWDQDGIVGWRDE